VRVVVKESVGVERMNEMLMMKKECYEGKATTRYILEQIVGVRSWL